MIVSQGQRDHDVPGDRDDDADVCRWDIDHVLLIAMDMQS